MAFLLSPICNESQIDSNGDPLSGGFIETYLAGTSTPAPTYTSITGAVPQTNPIVLNVLGLPPQPIWLDSAVVYKFVIKNSIGIVQRTVDNVAGISSSIPTQDQWVNFVGTPTFISATSFSVTGDQTSIFQRQRRVRTVNTAGIVYSTVSASVFGAVTTVTIVNDSGVLDSGLSQVSYGLLSSTNVSYPSSIATNSYITGTGLVTLTTTGTAPAFVATTLSNEIFPTFSLVSGYKLRVAFHTNGGIPSNTLNVNGSGAFPVGEYNQGGIIPGVIVVGVTYDLLFNGAQWVILNPIGKSTAGEYFWWPTGTTPAHGLLCNGAAVSRATFGQLFNRISTLFGAGDGSTTFNVPNATTGFALVHGTASEGSNTTGAVISHSHSIQTTAVANTGAARLVVDAAGVTVSNTNATGGTNNLAAGIIARLCIRF